jgi:F-type H+-transporting ATPase subunit delta
MKNVKLAHRYAKALFDFAIEKKCLETVYQDILLVLSILKFSHELHIILESPIVHHSKKVAIFKDIFQNQVSEVSFGFLRLVVDKRREPALLLMGNELIKLYYVHHHIKIAELIVSQEVSNSIIEKMKQILQEQTQAFIQIHSIVKPELLGGFIIKMDDFVFDASILRQINQLKAEFSQNIYQAGF